MTRCDTGNICIACFQILLEISYSKTHKANVYLQKRQRKRDEEKKSNRNLKLQVFEDN